MRHDPYDLHLRRAVVLLGLLAAACQPTRQYLYVPGATVTEGVTAVAPATSAAPLVTPSTPTPTLTPGDQVTLTVDFSPITEITVTELRVVVVELDATFVLALTPEEMAARIASVEVGVTAERPPEETCRPRGIGGTGWCAVPADEGTTEVSVDASDGQGVSAPAPVALMVLPAPDAAGPGLTCEPLDLDACVVQACCTATRCEYRVGGLTFACDGYDCNRAAQDVVAYCVG